MADPRRGMRLEGSFVLFLRPEPGDAPDLVRGLFDSLEISELPVVLPPFVVVAKVLGEPWSEFRAHLELARPGRLPEAFGEPTEGRLDRGGVGLVRVQVNSLEMRDFGSHSFWLMEGARRLTRNVLDVRRLEP